MGKVIWNRDIQNKLDAYRERNKKMSKKRNIRLNPHNATANQRTTEAWWYENDKNIDVYMKVRGDGGHALSCRIKRAYLKDWLKRTEKLR